MNLESNKNTSILPTIIERLYRPNKRGSKDNATHDRTINIVLVLTINFKTNITIGLPSQTIYRPRRLAVASISGLLVQVVFLFPCRSVGLWIVEKRLVTQRWRLRWCVSVTEMMWNNALWMIHKQKMTLHALSLLHVGYTFFLDPAMLGIQSKGHAWHPPASICLQYYQITPPPKKKVFLHSHRSFYTRNM